MRRVNTYKISSHSLYSTKLYISTHTHTHRDYSPVGLVAAVCWSSTKVRKIYSRFLSCLSQMHTHSHIAPQLKWIKWRYTIQQFCFFFFYFLFPHFQWYRLFHIIIYCFVLSVLATHHKQIDMCYVMKHKLWLLLLLLLWWCELGMIFRQK